MRTLIKALAISVTLPITTQGAPAGTSFRSSVKFEKGSTGFTNTNANSASSQTSSVNFQTGSYFSNFDLRLGMDRSKSDYSRYVITDRAGTRTDLSKSFDRSEHTVRIGSSIYLKQTTLSLDGSKPVGATPFPGNTVSAALNYELLARGTKFHLSLKHSDHKSPDSFFIDPDNFSTKRRPSRTLENKMTIGAEQILTETAKIKFSMFAADKPGNRPLQRGGDLGIAKAVSDVSAFLFSAGLAREKTSDPLIDDRGYFQANWAHLEYRYQPTYRWEFSTKVGTILEKESTRGRLPQHKVGTDTLGISALSHWKFGELGAFVLGARSNTGYGSFTFGGNLTWNL